MAIPRRGVLGLICAGASAAALVPLAAVADDPAPVLPDLVADPPGVAYLQHYIADPHGVGLGDRLLLRFPGYVTNAGSGALDLQGDPRSGALVQHAEVPGTGLVPVQAAAGGPPPVSYATADGHDHWHLAAATEYSLWDEAGATRVRAGAKVGFCLYDSERTGTQGPAAAVYDSALTGDFCGRDRPDAPALRMGVSAGWRDVYGAGLAFQWVDVSDVPPGRYRVGVRADPADVVRESDEANPTRLSEIVVTVPGHVATAVGPVSTGHGTPVEVTLQGATYSDAAFGVPGTRRFRIVTAPANGALTAAGAPVGAGGLLPPGADTVTYTPRAGFEGADPFTVAAEDAGSRFPTDAAGTDHAGAVVAPVTVVVGAPRPTVAVGGLPRRLAAGARVRLRAHVSGAAPGVVWRVDGRRGGSRRAGTVTAGGVYTAPAVPPGRPVTITAQSRAVPAAVGRARVTVTAARRPRAAPSAAAGTLVRGLMSRPAVVLRAGRAVVSVRVGPAGRVTLSLVRGGRRVDACTVRVRASAGAACALRPGTGGGLVATARLVSARSPRGVTLRRPIPR